MKRFIGIFIMIFALVAIPSASASVGTTTILSIADYPGAGPSPGEGQDWKYNVGATAQTVNRLNVYLGSGNRGKPELGLYNSASPHAKLASCTITAPVINTWNSCTIPATNLAANTAVWLAVLQPTGQSDVQIRRADTGLGSFRLGTGGKASLPAAWSDGSNYGVQTVSMYADSSGPPPSPQCSDGVDNSDPEDTLVDYPADPGCTSTSDNDETDPPPVDTTSPDTSITSQPTDPTTSTSAAFSFTGSDNVGVTGFDCKLDTGNYIACSSPASYNNLSVATHTFNVRAKDAAGNVDPTPATYSWTVQAGGGGTEPVPIAGQGYHEAWRDDFNGTALNSADWWTKQFWTDYPAPGAITVHDGMVSIQNRKGDSDGVPGGTDGYPDTVDITTGPEWGGDSNVKHSWQFGYFEARMKMTDAKGAWGAFWLGSVAHATWPNWPSCPEPDLNYELDIFEQQGDEPFNYHGTQHRNTGDVCGVSDQQPAGVPYDVPVPTRVQGDWHKFAVKWTASSVTYYYDDQPVRTESLFDSGDQQMFLLLTMQACGWDSTNSCGSTTPAVLETSVDYIKVWQQ